MLGGLSTSFQGLDLPLIFERNAGQADESVAYLSHNGGFSVYAAERGPVLALPAADGISRVEVVLIGGATDAAITGSDRQAGTVNYFIGDDPAKWRTNIPTFGAVTYESVYPGIDMVLYGNESGQLEYDFIVAPGADPSAIQLTFSGAESLTLERDGSLTLGVGGGEVSQKAPVLYQDSDTGRRIVRGAYVINGDVASFDIGPYDATEPLVIDPVLAWGAYLGGAATDFARAVATDAEDNIYVTGQTQSLNFPVTSGAYNETFTGTSQADVFVTKINPDGTDVIYSTYIGGTGSDVGYDIEVAGTGEAFVAGIAGTAFPVTGGAFATAGGGFVLKLAGDGTELIYSTKLGSNTGVYGLEIDDLGQAYFAGHALQSTFATTDGVFQEDLNGNGDGIVGVLNDDGTALIWGSYIGGEGREFAYDVGLDGDGYVYLTGETPSDDFPTVNPAYPTKGLQSDAFVARIMPDGSSLMWSTYLGGDGGGTSDSGTSIAADGNGNAYVTGVTVSSDFPLTNGSFQGNYGGNQDAFVTKFGPNGNVVYSTFLGGGNVDKGEGIEVDAAGNAYVGGLTASTDFPTAGPIQANNNGRTDAFISQLNPAGTALVFSTYLGGSEVDRIGESGDSGDGGAISVDEDGTIYAVGTTESPNFPANRGSLVAGLGGDVGAQGAAPNGTFDAFVVKIGNFKIGGDVDCSGTANPIDSLKILRDDAGLPNAGVPGCPNIGDEALINGVQRIWGDLNCNGSVDPVDSLVVLRYDAGLAINLPNGCPTLGEILTVEPLS